MAGAHATPNLITLGFKKPIAMNVVKVKLAL
jgi:hypothetical protein